MTDSSATKQPVSDGEMTAGERQWWLAELDQYGNPRLTDGAHSDRAGVEQAAYLIKRLGLTRDRKFACAEVTLTPVDAKPHGANEDALSALSNIGPTPAVKPDTAKNGDRR